MQKGLALVCVIAPCLAFPAIARAEPPFNPNYPEPDLPAMEPCTSTTPRELPVRWQATTLMAPYLYTGKPYDLHDLSSRAELQVGRFVYDGDNQLMRGTRYGAKLGGVVDLLISEKKTWVLSGSYENPQCVATLAHPYKVPGRIWQDQQYQPVCVGNHATAPTIETGPKVDWWKQKSPVEDPGTGGKKAEAADWYWFDEKGYPTRTMFWYKHDGLPAILGDYAFTNFYQFAPGNDIDLKKIAASCESATLPAWGDDKVLELQTKTQTQEANPAGKLIPGLSYQACARLDAKPPTWPVPIYMTSFSTAAKYATPRPLVTSVYYRPTPYPEIRTRLHKGGDHAPFWSHARKLLYQAKDGGPLFSDALLIDRTSFGIDFEATPPYHQKDCARGPHTSLPGSPRADWGVPGHCQCMSVLEDNPVFSPGRNTEIIGCPLPLVTTPQKGNTMFFMWYTVTDPMRPVVFMQTKPDVTIGTGLSLADYTHWQQQDVPDEIFTTPDPKSCVVPPASDPVPPPACMGCHNDSTNGSEREAKRRGHR
jgi:hypothetical protein